MPRSTARISTPPSCRTGDAGNDDMNRSCGGAFFGIALAAAFATVTPGARAGSAEEDFRGGLSAFNRGDFAAAMRLRRPLADGDDARSPAGVRFPEHRR